MKFLNLDKFSKTTGRFLKIDGVDHPIMALGVGQFIDTSHTIRSTDLNDAAAQLKVVMDTIIMLVPSITEETLRPYTPEQINEIAAFVRGEDVEAQEEIVAEGDEAGK